MLQGTRLRAHAQWKLFVDVHVVKRHAIVDVLCPSSCSTSSLVFTLLCFSFPACCCYTLSS